jgi:hypothetical protein
MSTKLTPRERNAFRAVADCLPAARAIGALS